MREYHKTMDSRMFDFPSFYREKAKALPNNCKIVEVGVANGASAIFLAEALLNLGKRFTFCLVDDFSYGGREQMKELFHHIGNANLLNCVEILPYGSLEASCHFPDDHFDFVFIDASHLYEQTKADIRLWYRKVKDEGILAGHDLNQEPVGRAVREVIPYVITRDPIPNQQEFEPEQVLRWEDTDKGCGLWYLKKQFYIKLN